MYTQMQQYRDNVAVDRSDTYKLDLPRQGLLSFIYAEVTATQTGAPYQAGTTGKWRVVDYISDLTVRANGRSDIVTVPGTVAQYRAFLDQGITTMDLIREYSNASQKARFLLNFGDYMWDFNKALNLAEYDNVEFNISNVLSISEWQDDTHVDVWLGWLRDHSLPSAQFNKLELWREITTTQDGREYLELPTGLPVRRIIVQVYPDRDGTYGMNETGAGSVLQDCKLTYRNGQYSIFDGNIEELWQQNLVELGYEQLTQGASYHQADYGFDVGIGQVRGIAAISGARDGAGSSTVPTREGDQDECTQKLEAYEADSPVDYIAKGCGYQNCGVFRYDRDPNGADLLDPSPSGLGVVELELHTRNQAAAADGTIRVVLDRLASARQIAG